MKGRIEHLCPLLGTSQVPVSPSRNAFSVPASTLSPSISSQSQQEKETYREATGFLLSSGAFQFLGLTDPPFPPPHPLSHFLQGPPKFRPLCHLNYK